MKNRSLILLTALLIVLSSFDMGCISSHADDNSKDEETMRLIIEDANSYIAENYGIEDYYPSSIVKDGIEHRPSMRVYQKYHFIAYYSAALPLEQINPSPKDRVLVKPGDRINPQGETLYRYVGYDAEGKLLINPNFPPDNLGSKPDDSGLYDFGSSVNGDWLKLTKDKARVKAKDAVEANFKKSVISTVDDMIGLYFLYHDPPFQNTKAYREAWVKLFERMFQSDLNTKIDVVLLPSLNAHGIAVFRYNSGYYTVAFLKFQERTDAILRIHHIVIEGEAGAYKVSSDFHPINSHKDTRVLKQGQKSTVRALESEAYDCVGHRYYPNLDGSFRTPYSGAGVGGLISSPEFNYIYKYEIGHQEPHLVFYYKKRPGFDMEERRGRIVISSPKYNVSRAIPTDEKVKVETHVDDARCCSVLWGGGRQSLNIGVKVTGFMNSDLSDSFMKEVEYHKLHYHRIYRLNRALVRNPKLSPRMPITQFAPVIPKSEARIYSQNILGLSFPTEEISMGGHRFEIITGEDEDGLFIELSALGDSSEDYLSYSQFRNLLHRLKAACRVKVRNDYLSIGGEVISRDTICEDIAPKPKSIEPRPLVLVKAEHYIGNSAKNGNSLTAGSLIYEKELGEGVEQLSFPVEGNNVFIHTPALNTTDMEDVSAFDQRTEAQKKRDEERFKGIEFLSLPLDHVTELRLFSEGGHIKEKGYGTKDYEENLRFKLVRLPFDAYVSKRASHIEGAKPEDRYFQEEGSLIRLDPGVKKLYIKAAPWVREGLYRIKTYAVAENASDIISPEPEANLDFHKDAAEKELPVLISGRLFDFTVEKVLDPSYLSTGGGDYWDSGLMTKDAKLRKRFRYADEAYRARWTLPLTAEKSPYKHKVKAGVKLGYPIVFSVKSMGSFFTKDDVVVFKPRFYHIAPDGRVSGEIALFYKKDGALIRLGSEEDRLRNYAVFKSFAGLDNQELIRDSGLLYGERASSYRGEEEGFQLSDLPSPSSYMSSITRPVFISKPSYALASPAFRVFCPASLPQAQGIARERVGMSLQKWYGSYHLPSSTLVYALDEEGRPDFNRRLREGSLGLSFDMGIARSYNKEGFELSYLTDGYNGWKIQNYQGSKELPEGLVVLYSLDKSMDEDYIIR